MHSEGLENINDYYAAVYRGWFTAPETTQYRFHQTCDDQCDLNIGTTPGQSRDTKLLLDINYYNSNRRVSITTTGN